MKKFREIISRETGVVVKMNCILMLHQHYCAPLVVLVQTSNSDSFCKIINKYGGGDHCLVKQE